MKTFIFFLLLVSLNAVHAENYMESEANLFSRSYKYVKGLVAENNILKIGVIYNPASGKSIREAEAFKSALGKSAEARQYDFQISLIDINHLETHADIQVAYIAVYNSGYYPQIYQYSLKNHVFTISKNKSCVESQCCILAFDTSRGLQIYLNQSTLRTLGFGVKPAFKFMVKRV